MNRLLSVLVVCAGCFITAEVTTAPVHADCFQETANTGGGANCLKKQTSLACLDTSTSDRFGAEDLDAGKCGSRRCFLIFACSCGRPVAGLSCFGSH